MSLSCPYPRHSSHKVSVPFLFFARTQVNAASLLGFGIVAFRSRTLPLEFAIGLPLALLAVKLAASLTANQYLAHLDFTADQTDARKDYLRHSNVNSGAGGSAGSDASVSNEYYAVGGGESEHEAAHVFDRAEAKRDGFSFAGVSVPPTAASASSPWRQNSSRV
jgi:hypothetical protein